MSTTYFVAVRPQSNEHHTVHKEGCPFMPDDSKRIYLGHFQSPGDALNAGKRHFDKSDSCRFCSKEHHADVHKDSFREPSVPINILSIDRVAASWESALQCGVN